MQKLDSCRGDVHKAPSNLKALMEFKRLKTKIFLEPQFIAEKYSILYRLDSQKCSEAARC